MIVNMKDTIVRCKWLWALIMLMPVFVATGCTRHNGDIGDLFGEWRLEKLTADGDNVELYSQDAGAPQLYTWAFQGNIIRLNTIYAHNRVIECYGTWSLKDDILELLFIYKDNEIGTENRYRPPKAMHFSPDGITRLHVDRLTGKKMEASYVSDDGVEYRYYLSHPH